MFKHLSRDMETLQRHILEMAGEVEEMVYQASRALRNRDATLAAEVVAHDNDIDLMENEIQEECLKILALHQPVAGDLRRVTAVFSITTDLERIGDLAVDIAGRALALAEMPEAINFEVPEKMERLTDLAAGLARQSLDAFVNLDTRQARRVIRLDDEVDRVYVELVGELIERMKSSPSCVEPGLSWFSAAKHTERIGDHATNIAEDVVYLVEGDVIRHRTDTKVE